MALLPPFFLDSVVALGVGHDPKERRWGGTGFIFGQPILPTPQGSEPSYNLWLITNKHVLSGLKDLYIKLNSSAEPNSKDYRVDLVSRNGRARWVGHPNADTDVAAIFLNATFMQRENLRFAPILADKHACTKAALKSGALNEGDRVFVLGFPMGLVSPERQYVICRNGIIARIRDYLEEKASDFLIDAPVFPGNSGGPVVSCPTEIAIEGTQRPLRAELIGIVKSYVPYIDVAVSRQTGNPPVTFEENSGLTAVEPIEAILATVTLAERRIESRRAQAKFKAKRKSQAQPKTQVEAPAAPPAPAPTVPEAPTPQAQESPQQQQLPVTARRRIIYRTKT